MRDSDRSFRSGLGALVPLVPPLASAATVVLYLGNWPERGNRGLQLAIGLGVACVLWLVAAWLMGGFLSAASASPEVYEDLRGRAAALKARAEALAGSHNGAHSLMQEEALKQVDALVGRLDGDLGLGLGRASATSGPGSPYRWLLGQGYVNAWRELHSAEDLLLAVEPSAVVHAVALANLDRLGSARVVRDNPLLQGLTTLLVEPQANGQVASPGSQSWIEDVIVGGSSSSDGPLEQRESKMLEKFDRESSRSLVREVSRNIHARQNDAWEQLVNLRNRLFLTLVVAWCFTYALLGLVVLWPATTPTEVFAGVALFLAGAIVGLFKELHTTSRRKKGIIFDYGLGNVRLLAVPVLSGLAAIGGVLVTNLTASYVLSTANSTGTAISSLFDLTGYPMGLVVAAVFGLTPGLFLDRLRDRSDAYKQEIAQLYPSSTTGGAQIATDTTATPTAAVTQ